MSRTHRRVSRTLIGILAVTLVLGLAAWLSIPGESDAADAAAAPVVSGKTGDAGALAVTPQPASPVAAAGAGTGASTPAPKPAVPAPQVMQTPTAAATGSTSAAARPRSQAQATPAVAMADGKPLAQAIALPLSSGSESDGPAPAVSTANALARAKQQMEAGQTLDARTILAAAMNDGSLAPADLAEAKSMLATINANAILSPTRYDGDPHVTIYTVQPGDHLSRIAANHHVTWDLLCRINGMSDPRKLRAGQRIKVPNGPFHAIVDKSDYAIELYLGAPGERGSLFVTSFRVGLGADDSTPTGTWLVETDKKIKNPTYYSPRGEGVIEADDPSNPLGERWIGLTGIDGSAVGAESYGIHGTIEPETIGTQASMGCVRLLNENVEVVYEMLVEGQSTVIIRE